MLDVGWTELMLIGIVALIVIGPKDLPEMFRQLGRVTAKLRAMSREFQRAMEQAANESGVKDVAKDLKTMASPKGLGIDAMRDAASKFEKWDPLKNAARPTKPSLTPPLMPATPAPPATPPTTSPATPPASPTIHGPATQAQIDKQAAKTAILKDTAAKLKAVSEAPTAEPAPASKPRVKAPAPAADAAKPSPKPRAPRKPSKQADPA